MSDAFRFCPQCGSNQKGAFGLQADGPLRRLVRPRTDRKLAGVCAGIAQYLGVDVTLVRILTVVLALWPPGIGLIFYVVCWIVMPQEPLLLPAATPPPASQPQNLPVS